MKPIFRIDLLLASVLLIVAGASAPGARADSFVNYIGSPGAGGTDCSSPTSPCALWYSAQTYLVGRGSISCVNAIARYDGNESIAIDKSLIIDCKAGGGGADTSKIVINAPGKHVRIRNISLNLFASQTTLAAPAVEIIAADSVELDNVFVSGSSGAAILDRRAGPGKLSIRNSVIVDNTGPGIVVAPQSGTITAVLDNVNVRESSYGLAVGNGGRVMVNRSVFSQNSTAGIEADTGGIIELNDTLVSNNTTGIVASASSTISISSSGINSNNTGIFGSTRSYGNNRFFANAVSDGTVPTPAGSATSENGLR